MNAYEALHSDAALIDLSNRGKIRLTGEDAGRLLHAMSTNSVKDLAPGTGVYAFFLTAQGKILADAYIYRLEESFLLDTEPEVARKLAEHLDKYIIADDAEVQDETERWGAVGIEGPASYERGAALGISVPNELYSSLPFQRGFAVRIASTGPDGLRVFLPAEEMGLFVPQLEAAGLSRASAAEARLVQLERGLPRYGEDITERYLVQETGVLQAVHFSKGCYLGQEIVERVRSRAQVHRHLKPIRIIGPVAPAPGTKLVLEGKDVAEVTSAMFSPGLSEVVGLAYVRTEATLTKPELSVAGTDPAVSAHLA